MLAHLIGYYVHSWFLRKRVRAGIGAVTDAWDLQKSNFGATARGMHLLYY